MLRRRISINKSYNKGAALNIGVQYAPVQYNDIMKINVLQITDCHLFADSTQQLRGVDTEQSFLRVLAAICATTRTPDLILLTGDLADLGEADAYRRLLTHCQRLTCPVFAIPGNHDQVAVMKQIFKDSKISMNPSFVRGGWHVILLNSVVLGDDEGTLAPSELHFLQTALTHYATLPTLIALHHHVKPVHGYMDTMMLTNADLFHEIITAHKSVRVVLSGHVHQAFEESCNHVRYLASPSTCFQIKVNIPEFTKDETSMPGYRWLALYDDGKIETEVVRV